MILHGRVKNGVVVLQSDGAGVLPDGTLVEVIPVSDDVSKSPAAPAVPYHVSKEQKEALLGLIGIWKTDKPPSDEAVQRIVEEERVKKYG
jgi:hypothetical protein